MKKIIFFFIIILFFFGCNAKNNIINEEQNVEENDFELDISEESKQAIEKIIYKQANYGNENGTIVQIVYDGNNIWTYRKHVQQIHIGSDDSRYPRIESYILYDKPLIEHANTLYEWQINDMFNTRHTETEMPYIENSNEIGRLQQNDQINITQYVETFDSDDFYYYWLKVNTENNLEGWVFCGKHDESYAEYRGLPYFNNRWEILENIHSNNRTYRLRKLLQRGFYVTGEANIYDRPGLNNVNIVYKIIPSYNDFPLSYVNVIGMTDELETINVILNDWSLNEENNTWYSPRSNQLRRSNYWLKIDYKENYGWIFGGYLDIDRGGPWFYTPEIIIKMRFDDF